MEKQIAEKRRTLAAVLARIRATDDGQYLFEWLRKAYLDHRRLDAADGFEAIALAAARRDAQSELVQNLIALADAGDKPGEQS